jgi:hypothetical protein
LSPFTRRTLLDLSYPTKFKSSESFLNGIESLSPSLFQLRTVDLTGHYYINNQSLFHLFKNLQLLEEAIIFDCHKITNAGIASALPETPTMRSLSFTNYCKYDKCATLFTLLRNFPSFNEIRMEDTGKFEKSVQKWSSVE